MFKLLNPFLPHGLKRLFAYSRAVDTNEAYTAGANEFEFVDEARANLVTSSTGHSDWHLPVLDLDIDHEYVPSSTPGHAHLYLNVPVRWQDYQELLRLLQRMGVLEPGFVNASITKGATMVRKPGVYKQDATATANTFIPGDGVRVVSTGETGFVVPRSPWAVGREVSVRIDSKSGASDTVYFFDPEELELTFSTAVGF